MTEAKKPATSKRKTYEEWEKEQKDFSHKCWHTAQLDGWPCMGRVGGNGSYRTSGFRASKRKSANQ